MNIIRSIALAILFYAGCAVPCRAEHSEEEFPMEDMRSVLAKDGMDMDLVAARECADGSYMFKLFNQKEWEGQAMYEALGIIVGEVTDPLYQPCGIVFRRGGRNFVLSYADEYDELGGYADWQTAIDRYGIDHLPNKKEADLIQQCGELRSVAAAYGSDNYGNYYWTSTTCPAPDNDCAYIYCPGISDAAYDRCKKNDPSNNGVLTIFRF